MYVLRTRLGSGFATGSVGRSGKAVDYRPAPSAFLATSYLAWPLVSSILSPIAKDCFNLTLESAERSWLSLGDVTPPGPALRAIQCAWDDVICGMRVQAMLEGAIEWGGAWLLGCGAPSIGSWLNSLPTASLGLRLSDSEVRIAVCLRFKVPIVGRHTCTCGVEVLPDGHHGLSCKRGPGRQSRHNAFTLCIVSVFHLSSSQLA